MQRFWGRFLIGGGVTAIGIAVLVAFAAPTVAGTAGACFGLPGLALILLGRRAHRQADTADYARYMADREPTPTAQFKGLKRVAPLPPPPPPAPTRHMSPRSRKATKFEEDEPGLHLTLRAGLIVIALVVLAGIFIGPNLQSSPRDSGSQAVPTRSRTATATTAPRSTRSVAVPLSVSEPYRTTGNSNVRTCAGTTCSVVTTLPANTLVEVTGETNSRGATWYQVRLSDGRTGYMHSSTVRAGAQEFVAAPSGSNPTPAAGGSQANVRPRNCAEARALGLPADVIARDYPDLDRDKDGVACYDD